MPIIEIVSGASGPVVTRSCRCGNSDALQANDLTIGTASMVEAIVLPACSKCGAVEMLIRTTDGSTPERLSGHRRAVNALANYLQSAGKIAPSAASYYADPKTPAAAPVGELYGKVNAPSTSAPNPVAVALAALAAAQKALADARAAGRK